MNANMILDTHPPPFKSIWLVDAPATSGTQICGALILWTWSALWAHGIVLPFIGGFTVLVPVIAITRGTILTVATDIATGMVVFDLVIYGWMFFSASCNIDPGIKLWFVIFFEGYADILVTVFLCEIVND